jgi:2,3-bisphosphoglycerate-independent phosphoglycerate mutase
MLKVPAAVREALRLLKTSDETEAREAKAQLKTALSQESISALEGYAETARKILQDHPVNQKQLTHGEAGYSATIRYAYLVLKDALDPRNNNG